MEEGVGGDTSGSPSCAVEVERAAVVTVEVGGGEAFAVENDRMTRRGSGVTSEQRYAVSLE